MSGGERQRIMLSMVGMLDKKVVLVDEPTSALDVDSSLLVAGYLQGLAKRGTAIIAVSHDRAFAGQCDKTLMLNLHDQ